MSLEEEYNQLKAKVVERKKDFDEFINFLENKTTWLTAPASVRYHLSEEKGLLMHSVGVTKTLLKLRELLAPELSEESCVIVALFHDVGKIGMPDAPRYLKKGEKFVYNKNQVEMQIANRSLYLVSKYIPLSDEEAQAILYHDGQYIAENRFIAHKECPLTLLLTFADTWTCAVYEEGRKIKENKNYYMRDEMIKTKQENGTASIQKAQKHVKISLEVRDVINKIYPKYCVYIATHTAGRHGGNYRKTEEESGKKFWSLKLLSSPERKKLKDPDVIVSDGNKVKYLIEVKWGVINGCSATDADISKPERGKIEQARHLGGICHIRGPAITNGQHYYSKEFVEKKKSEVDTDTKFVLVSDFQTMKDVLPTKKYEDILFQLKEQSDIFVLADIHKHVDDIPSLQEIIQLDC